MRRSAIWLESVLAIIKSGARGLCEQIMTAFMSSKKHLQVPAKAATREFDRHGTKDHYL